MNFLILCILSLLVSAFALIEWFIPYFRKSMTLWFSALFVYIFPDLYDEKNDDFGRLKESLAKVAVNVTYSIIIIFLISFYFSVIYPVDENKLTGPLGDLFNGILAPVLSFLTFCGLLVTIFIQQHQLKLTLREFELNRQENAKSTEALEGQLKNSYAQKFDANFYSLLEKQEKIISDFSSEKEWSSRTLRDVYEGRKHSIQWSLEKDIYLKFFLINYQILDFISFSLKKFVIDDEEARRYRNIVRAVTPNDFLALLLINCQDPAHKDYKSYLIEARYFEHFSFVRSSPAGFAKLFHSWPLAAFGDKARLNEFFRDRKSIICHFLGSLPMDLYERLEKLKSLSFIYSDEIIKDVQNKCESCERVISQKLDDLDTEKISNDEELFSAFTSCNSVFFLNYLHIDISFIDELRTYITNRLNE